MLRAYCVCNCLVAGCFIAGHAMAAGPPVWTGAGNTDNWKTGFNWSNQAAPANDGTADIVLAGEQRLTPIVDVNWSINSLAFDSRAGQFILGGNRLTIGRGGIINNGENAQVINNTIVLDKGQTWDAAAGPLSFGGSITNNGTLTVGGGFTTRFDSSLSGGGALTMNGNGLLYFGAGAADSAANTYTGVTTVNAGALILDKATGTVAVPGDLAINGGGYLTVSRIGLISPTSNLTLNTTGSASFYNDGTSQHTLKSMSIQAVGALSGRFNLTSESSTLTVGGGLTIPSSVYFNLSGAASSITLSSSTLGTTTLPGIDFGWPGPATFFVADNPAVEDLVFSGVLNGGHMVKSGPGTMSFSGGGRMLGNSLTINEGTLRTSTLNGFLGGGGIFLNGGTLQAASGITLASQILTIGPLGSTIDTGDYDVVQEPGYFSNRLTGTGPLLKTGAGMLHIGGPDDLNSNNYSGKITVIEGTFSLGAKRLGSVGTNGDIDVLGSGSLVLRTYAASHSNVLFNSTGSITTPLGTATVRSLTELVSSYGSPSIALDSYSIGGGVQSPTEISFIGSGGGVTRLNNAPGDSLMAGAINLGGQMRAIAVGSMVGLEGAGDLTMSGVISNGGIHKSGPGKLHLTGANTYSAGTEIYDGTVQVWADNALGSAGSILFNRLANPSILRTSSSFTLTHPITGYYPEISVDVGTTLTVAAQVDAFGMYKSGGGTMVLGAANALSGPMFLDGGTVAIGNDAALGFADAFLRGGSIRAEGAARTIANDLYIYADSLIGGSLDLTFTGAVSLDGPHVITVNNNTTFSGTTLAGFTKSGPGTLVLSGNVTGTDAITNNAGVLAMAGGAINAPIINNDRFRYTAGTLNGRVSNFGTMIIEAAQLDAGNGIANFGNITLPQGTTLNVGGAGLDNQGLITGGGVIRGSGVLNNVGEIRPSGVLALGNSGAITNSGQIEIASGSTLQLTGMPLSNMGTIRMNGGIINGTSRLINQSGGTITGRGTISAPVGDSAGQIAVSDGTLSIVNGFNNYGVVQVAGIAASLAGGTIQNHGTIEGFGSIANSIVNYDGSVEATGGTLILSSYSSTPAGLLAAATATKLVFRTGLALSGGIVSLAGGTFDNNGFPISNTGQISGYGIFRSGSLTNNGAITFAGGTTTINGDVTNSAGKKIEVRYAPAVFTGNFTNNGIFKSTGATVTFTGIYTENGQFMSDPAENFFEDVIIGAGGAWSGGFGDRFIVSGNLINGSAAADQWETSTAELRFTGGGLHQYLSPSRDLGSNSFAGFDNNFAWGTLALGAGDSLALQADAIYVGVLDLAGGLDAIASISGDTTLYYDLRESANAYLNGQSYPLAGGGMIAPVPEPACAMLLLIPAALFLRRRQSINCI